MAEKVGEGFAESERSLTRRVFATADRFWIVWLGGDTVGTQSGGIRADWREATGQTRAREFRDRARAVAAYHAAVAEKEADGYRERYERAVAIAAVPKAPRKPGKKKAR